MNENKSTIRPSGEPISALATEIRDRLEGASQLYHRLVLIVGAPGTGKQSRYTNSRRPWKFLT
jgi:hypothetical protein